MADERSVGPYEPPFVYDPQNGTMVSPGQRSNTPRTDREKYVVKECDIGFQVVGVRLAEILETECAELRRRWGTSNRLHAEHENKLRDQLAAADRRVKELEERNLDDYELMLNWAHEFNANDGDDMRSVITQGIFDLKSRTETAEATLVQQAGAEPMEQLSRAWSENKCGDQECEEYRLKAAIAVLAGGTTHKENADKIYGSPPIVP